MAEDIVVHGKDDGQDPGVTERQVAALEQLHALGAAPREDGQPYSSDRRVRAQQLIYEGRMGGPRQGSGRPRNPRASEAVAQYVRERLTPKIKDALRDGLDDDDINVRLKTVDKALHIEREEASLQLQEEKADLDNVDKEQLIATLIALTSDPGTEAALEGAVITLPESSVTEIPLDNSGDSETGHRNGEGTAAIPTQVRSDVGEDRSNGTGDSAKDIAEHPNPFATTLRRRSANRRRAS